MEPRISTISFSCGLRLCIAFVTMYLTALLKSKLGNLNGNGGHSTFHSLRREGRGLLFY